jgi:hypothetical protein
MPKFLKDGEILETVKEVIHGGIDCRLAVAYWGNGAAEKIGIDSAKGEKVHIICDPWGGACSKDELLSLSRNPRVKLRHLKDLHAKVYLTSKGAVVGSANASTKGLGKSDGQPINHEAAVRLEPNEDCSDLRDWFDSKWKAALPLIEQTIKSLPALKKSPPVPKIPKPTVLEVMEIDPDWFRENRVRLVVYEDEDASQEALDLYEKTAGEVYDKATLEAYDEENSCPYFEIEPGWSIDHSEIVVCFSYSERKRPEWAGIWTLKDEEPRTDKNVTIVFVDAHNNHQKVRDLKLPASERAQIAEKIDAHVRATGFSKDQFGELIDMNLADFWKGPLPEHPWFQKLDPEARKRIISFADKQDRNVEKILVGRIGGGERPNFRFQFKDGVKDFDGKTYKRGKFDELKGGIKNPKNLVELRRA